MNTELFISRFTNYGLDTEEYRKKTAEKFAYIHNNIDCKHDLADAFYIADYILRYKDSPGVIVEFGCYAGGMTAKLSLLASDLGKKYYIFDSFMGLPQTAVYQTYEPAWSHLGNFKQGEFASTLEKTKENIEKYGSVDCCVFVPGWIEINLSGFKEQVMCCFIDVDIIETAKDIIKHVWPKITTFGLFTHEACIKDYMQAVLNPNFWDINFNIEPPKCLSDFVEKPHKFHGLPAALCLDFIIKEKDFNKEIENVHK